MVQSILHPQPGPSRAAKMDIKRSEEPRTPGVQTAKKTDKIKSKTAKPSADNTNNKKSKLNAIARPKLRICLSQSDIEESSYSVVKTISSKYQS